MRSTREIEAIILNSESMIEAPYRPQELINQLNLIKVCLHELEDSKQTDIINKYKARLEFCKSLVDSHIKNPNPELTRLDEPKFSTPRPK